MSNSIKSRKSKLLERSNNLKSALSKDFSEMKEHSKEIGIAGLMFIGVLAAGFITYKLLSSSSSEEQNSESGDSDSTKIVYVNSGSENPVFNEIMRSIATFLLGIAKEKLLEFMEKRNKSSE